jgi:hypothetical protein
MARLPKPGGDTDTWAKILNEFLLVAHNPDGTPRTEAVNALAAAAATVGLLDLRTANQPTDPSIRTPILSNNGTELIWRSINEINVRDFGAKGDGVTDDTAAIQAAIDAIGDGGNIHIPEGTFMVRGIKIKRSGTRLAGDARWGTRLVRLSGTQPLIDVSGTASMTGHMRYSTIANMTLNGNHMPGPLLRSYYSDSSTFSDVHFVYCAGVATDLIEAWDTRFLECIWENCGTETAPAVLLRNTQPPGQFGYSDDNTNQIYFTGCRWETFRNGAIKMDGAANGSPRKLNGIFFTSCKMETRFCAGPVMQIMPGTTIVFVNQLYVAIMAALPTTAKPIDAIIDYGTHVFMTDVYVQWGFEVTLANSLVHVYESGPHMYYKLSTFYPTGDPVEAAIIAEPGSTDVIVSCNVTNRGRLTIGDVGTVMVQSADAGVEIPINASGAFIVSSHVTGKDLIKMDNSGTRPVFIAANGVDVAGFSDNYSSEKWRVVGASGAARFAGGKFQIEGTKGYVGIGTAPFTGIALLIEPTAATDRGLAIVRPSATATGRMLEFQDETNTVQGQAFDAHGRPIAMGTPAQVTAGAQVTYANPRVQVRDIAGNITAAVKPSPTAPGTIARITFSKPYAAAPLAITINDHSAISADLYVSARSEASFVVSTRKALAGGSILNFDYTVAA